MWQCQKPCAYLKVLNVLGLESRQIFVLGLSVHDATGARLLASASALRRWRDHEGAGAT